MRITIGARLEKRFDNGLVSPDGSKMQRRITDLVTLIDRDTTANHFQGLLIEELRLHNKQLVSCVEALENSRQEHETDAERYREQADQSEKESETLRLKLEDLKQNFERCRPSWPGRAHP